MGNSDLVSNLRNLLTQYRESLTEYENRWNIETKEYRGNTDGNTAETFQKLLRTSKQLLLNLEHLYIRNHALEDRQTILQRMLESLITDPKVEQNYQKELDNWKNNYEPQFKSFFNRLDRERQ